MTGPSHHEPLDEHEREVARVLRALPGGEPSAALDQRILRMAADASAGADSRPARKPVRRWVAFGGGMWGIGGAAAAVLALGVGWHLIDPTRQQASERSAPVEVRSEADPVTVEFPDAPAANFAAPASPAPSKAGADTTDAAAVSRPPQARTAPPSARARLPEAFVPSPPPPPPAPAPVVAPSAGLLGAAEPRQEAAVQDSAINAIDVDSVESTAILTAEQLQRQAAEADVAQAKSAQESERTAAAALAERSARAQRAAPSRNVLAPSAWLGQIRQLRDQGHVAEAAASLRRFRQYYPQVEIPADLAPLLGQ